MWPFGRKMKPAPSREQVLSAKPVRLVEDVPEPDGKGGARLKVKLKQSRFVGRVFKMPEGATKTFELDEIGLLVWNACDGKTSAKRLVELVAMKYGITPREAEVSTFAFLQTLAKKGLIGLAVDGKKNEDGR
jgi:hypothetical protein